MESYHVLGCDVLVWQNFTGFWWMCRLRGSQDGEAVLFSEILIVVPSIL
jgi:hypothetical protein